MTLKKFFGLATIVGIFTLLVMGYLAYASFIKLEQVKVIKAAKDYEPKPYLMCTAAMTPAKHNITGARYTFPNGCIPKGWTIES